MTDLIKETIAPIIALADHIILTVMERRGYPQGYKDAMRDRPKRRATNRLQNKRLQTMKFNIKPQIIIGIDPDVEASGLGIINTTSAAGLLVDYMTLPLPKLVEQLEAVATTDPGTPVRIFIEAGWLNKGNWHLNPHDNKQLAAAKGRQAGRNHQLGLDLCALLDHRGIPHTEVLPLIKCWKGKDRKITHEELDTEAGMTLPDKKPGAGCAHSRRSSEVLPLSTSTPSTDPVPTGSASALAATTAGSPGRRSSAEASRPSTTPSAAGSE